MDFVSWVVEGGPLVAVFLLVTLMPLTPALTTITNSLSTVTHSLTPALTTVTHSFIPQHANKLYKRVQKAGQKIVCDVVREIYASDRMNTANGMIPVAEYCKLININPVFDERHQHILMCNMMETDFDVFFGYDVLSKVCVHVYDELSAECNDDISKLCELVVEEVSSKTDISSSVESLRRTQRDIYKCISQVLQKDFSQNLAVAEAMLNYILETDLKCNEIYIAEESGISISNNTSPLVSKCYWELSERYEKLGDLNPRTWMTRENDATIKDSSVEYFQTEKIFTQLKILEGKRVIDMKDLLSVTRKVYGEVKVPKALLLHGLAGSGKTSLCRYLVHDWRKGGKEISALCHFDLVFFVEVRRVRSNRLREFFRDELMPTTCIGLESENIIPALKELDIIFVIDGYDETDKVSSELLEDIFAKFGEKRIIMTTRPELHMDAVCMARRHEVDYMSLEVCGFDVDKCQEFSKKVFSIMEENETECSNQTREFLECIHERGKLLGKYLTLPLTTALLILSWRHNPEVVNPSATATRIYQEFYHLLHKKLAERLSKDFIGVSELPDILDGLLLCLGEQAWTMVKEELSTVPDTLQKKIEIECEAKRIKVVELLSGFHMCHLPDDPDVWKLKVAFLHSSQRCYFAATFLAHCLHKKLLKIQDIGNQVNACLGLEQVLLFLTGHLALQNNLATSTVNDIFNVLKKIDFDPQNFDFWWHMFVESHRHPQVGAIIARDKLPHKHWQLDDANVVSALKLLSFTPVRLMSLSIDIPSTKEPHEIPSFLQVLQEVGQHLRKRQKKNVKVELHLRKHVMYDQKTSDDFLRALESWSDLTSFKGSFGEQPKGEELLVGSSSLRTMQIRVATLGAFTSLSNGLRKICKSVRSLHVTLALLHDCTVESLSELRHNGNLELTLMAMKDRQKEWLVSVVKTVGGRYMMAVGPTTLTYSYH
ncbi:NACHT, LRR and PYD domains-containing protein 10-like 4 [Homarus americanus]|uniref:NACHT, LRR and PYD domains-containing protein 10-like 4 n=1 Tax=Homarus americanus TaxID=6706 RepID=A0A8J5K5V0_HOMAM|nr:NACHT, LRR and PYD domains-containing protein 10-like 4 [Homarus americanus]